MSAYEDDADRFAEHMRETCDDPYCQVCIEEEEAEDELGDERRQATMAEED